MQHEAFGHHLNDIPCFGSWNWRFKHGFVILRIKALTNFGRNGLDAMFFESIDNFPHGELNPLNQGR